VEGDVNENNLTRQESIARASLIADAEYEIRLDLTGDDTFGSDTTIRFSCSDPGASVHLDFDAPSLSRLELNGQRLPEDAWDGRRVLLEGLQDQNEVRVAGKCRYRAGGFGMYRFEDPVDGNVYCATHFEPFGSHRVFACFDQPDIKGTFTFTVRAPSGWDVVSNARSNGSKADGDGAAEWSFEPTAPLSTYLAAVAAGPFHSVRDQLGDIDLGWYCRQSLAQYLDPQELFEVTKQGFEFFESAYGYPYPFGKYDQVFAPEFTSGAMENAGLVIYNELYVFRSRVTDALRERRGDTILHEMAHMWFGDLVTMRWWSDLWLNESFASYMAVLAQSKATRWADAWSTFANTEKTWALKEDQLPTTHPIVADIPDVESIHLNFDGITYAKGAAVLRQLVAWVGEERFLDGVQAYIKRNEFRNAELADFLGALEEVSGRDLRAWSKEWLETAGVNTLRAEFDVSGEDGKATFDRFNVVQGASPDHPTLRRHRLAVGLYDRGEEGLVRRSRVELDIAGPRTEVGDLAGEPVPDLVLVNDDDLTFAKIRLDQRSLATVVDHMGELGDPLARAVCWAACWDMTRDAEMRPRDYVRLVLNSAGAESRIGLLQTLLAQAASAVWLYGDPANRESASDQIAEAALASMRSAEPGSDHQLAWTRAFTAEAHSSEHLKVALGLLDGTHTVKGLAVDTELRWHIVRSLAGTGAVDEDAIEAELQRDPTDLGKRHAAAARAARPDPEAKEEAWRAITEDPSVSLALLGDLIAGFQRYGQEDLLEPYAARFFEALPGVWEARDLSVALAFGRGMFPRLIVNEATVELTDRYLGNDRVPGPFRRLLVEGRDGILRALRTRAADAG
jgi:aminopeptidase N